MLDEVLSKLKKELENIRKDVDSIDKENITEDDINNLMNISERFIGLINYNIPNQEEIINYMNISDSSKD